MAEIMVQAYGKNFCISEEDKNQIDKMTQYEMAYKIRFAPAGDALMCGDTGDYFMKRFKEVGGMTPEISKRLGWSK